MSHILKENKKILKFLRIILIFLFLFLSFKGINSYVGNKLYYVIFTIVNFYLLYFIFRKKNFFFDVFFGLLIFLGFWFKFTATISFTPFVKGQFNEGVGEFDYKPSSFDEVLLISCVGLLGFIVAGHLREFIINYPKKIKFEPTYEKFFLNYRNYIWILYLILILSVAFINIKFQIYQRGLVSPVEGNFIFVSIIKWLLLFGLTSLSTWILYNEIKFKTSNIYIPLLAFFETFLSYSSMLSRGMIFNSGSIFFGIYKFSKLFKKKMTILNSFLYLFFIFILFYLSVISVNHIRAKYFYSGESFNSTEIKAKGEVSQKIEKEIQININQQNMEIVYLIINRWVGIDAVMAVNSKKEILGINLIKNSFNERFSRYSNSFYEETFEIKNTYKKINNNVKGNTLTGIVAFLFYSGSLLILFFLMILICLFACFIEYLAFKLSGKNLIFAALIGQIIAFRLTNFGYLPHQSYLLFSAIFLSIFMIYILNMLLKNFEDN